VSSVTEASTSALGKQGETLSGGWLLFAPQVLSTILAKPSTAPDFAHTRDRSENKSGVVRNLNRTVLVDAQQAVVLQLGSAMMEKRGSKRVRLFDVRHKLLTPFREGEAILGQVTCPVIAVEFSSSAGW
jgi:hypothetical protein